MDEVPEKIKNTGIVTGALGTGAAIGSCFCPGLGTGIGAGIGAIVAGVAIIVKTVKENK